MAEPLASESSQAEANEQSELPRAEKRRRRGGDANGHRIQNNRKTEVVYRSDGG